MNYTEQYVCVDMEVTCPILLAHENGLTNVAAQTSILRRHIKHIVTKKYYLASQSDHNLLHHGYVALGPTKQAT